MKYILAFSILILSQTSIAYACMPMQTLSGLTIGLLKAAFLILLPVTVLVMLVLLITYFHKKKVFQKISKNPAEDILKIKKKYTRITLVFLIILIITFLVPIIGDSVFEVRDYVGCENWTGL